VSSLHRPVQLHSSLEEFTRAAMAYSPSHDPLPLLDGPSVRRDMARFERSGVLSLPAESGVHAVAFVPDSSFAGVAMLLARVANRPLLQTDMTDVAELAGSSSRIRGTEGTLTVVSPPHLLTPAVLESAVGHRTAFFTARDVSAACALLLRTLTSGAEQGTLLYDAHARYSRSAQRLGGYAVLPAALLGRPEAPRRVVAGRSSGRSCALVFAGGTLCGRATVPAPETPGADESKLQRSACLQSAGCFRSDLGHAEAVRQPRAADISAAAVFLDNCSGVQPAGGGYRTEVSLALALLDSQAVVVAGTPQTRVTAAAAAPLFAMAVATGQNAASAVETVNDVLGGQTAGPVVLLGDAACRWSAELHVKRVVLPSNHSREVVVPEPGTGVVEVFTDPSVERITVDGAHDPLMSVKVAGGGRWLILREDAGALTSPLTVTASPHRIDDPLRLMLKPALDALRELHELTGLDSPSVDLGDLRKGAGRVARLWSECEVRRGTASGGGSSWFEPDDVSAEFEGLREQVARAQREIVDGWLDECLNGRGEIENLWPTPHVFTDRRTDTCPNCHQRLLRVQYLRAQLSPLNLVIASCDTCGQVAVGDDDMPVSVSFRGPGQVAEATPFELHVKLTANAVPVEVALAAGVVGGKQVGASVQGPTRSVRLAPSEQRDIVIPGFVEHGALADRHDIGVAVIANGRLVLFTYSYFVTRDPW